ncbi:DUF805 domain-containing protein [Lacticaseibacillus saniviri]|uniref:DUF805 domain-containing protein n=1 Tax=Lacticaseibacillus saniviri JCM 17471 = DSM 24301 TaxID=1293598 RepID=A0A0R2MPE0_9LACO|nr:DUF805 domain-containing protein [Lacticaseibacillus saniviri]KRO15527.1 hypothetical protein IV56_GL002296 [Lacticaseibacillus saniviri JCM 17471 = DSM 24301]MCG4281650.1 DUF805 domain-containing protein [Lacticaseibacillus saniviri]
MMHFGTAVKQYFTRAFDFAGRSTRAAYWWAVLFIGIALGIIGGVVASFASLEVGRIANIIIGLLVLIPTFSLTIRRYRDAGIPVIYGYVIHGLIAVGGLVPAFNTLALVQHAWVTVIMFLLALVEFVLTILPSFDRVRITSDSSGKVGPFAALRLFFQQYAQFSGRSGRSAYWWMVMWQVILEVLTITIGVFIVTSFTFGDSVLNPIFPVVILGILLVILANVAIIIPSISLAARRYRDAGVNPWWLIFTRGLAVIAGPITSTNNTTIQILAGIVLTGLWLADVVIALLPSKQISAS